ncbi:hypothetical protein AB0I60_34665 [Actinosynnema sp. NPDC050436]|uniref:hypothetical protein n=1 Tax=Actinosynnema sp. NPDC050436 TaxID=3155659 RepID=UPI003411A0F2
MIKSVAVTGPRRVNDVSPDRLASLFDGYLRPFAGPDAHVHLGGAAGIDTLALDWLARHTAARLTVVVPCILHDQPALAVETVSAWRTRGRITEIVELAAPRLGSAAYHARNRWMVDRSSLIIGFPLDDDPASGTRYTLDYAAEQGKPRLVVPLGSPCGRDS